MAKCADCKNRDIKKGLNQKLFNNCEKGHFSTEDNIDVDKETSCSDFIHKFKYPEGSFITWCDEYYKIIKNHSDYSATVMDMSGDICRNFYFKLYGEEAILIKNNDPLIQELENCINESLTKKRIL